MNEFIPIKGYENYYSINKYGQIMRGNKILKNSTHTNGYKFITLCVDGKTKTHRIHRLLAINFIKNPESKPQVNHIDGNRQNNCLENLEWVTSSENNLHACRVTKNRKPPKSMLGKFGKDHNRSKSFVIEYENGKRVKYGSGLDFTRKTGLDHTSISYFRKRKNTHTFSKGRSLAGLTVHFELI